MYALGTYDIVCAGVCGPKRYATFGHFHETPDSPAHVYLRYFPYLLGKWFLATKARARLHICTVSNRKKNLESRERRSAISVSHELGQSRTLASHSIVYKEDGDQRLHIHIHMNSRRVPGAYYRVLTLEYLRICSHIDAVQARTVLRMSSFP